MQAQKLGFTVLTANIGDYDYLLQLIPAGEGAFLSQEVGKELRRKTMSAVLRLHV